MAIRAAGIRANTIIGSVFFLVFISFLKVEDLDTRQLVEPGHPGELVVRGPQVSIFKFINYITVR